MTVRKRAVVTVCLVALGTSIVWADVPAPGPPREGLTCGPNALYIFLLLCRVADATFERCPQVPIGEGGSSLLDLKRAALAAGVATDVRLFTVADVPYIPLPAIAQFRSPQPSLAAHHYMVLYRVDEERVYGIDATTGAHNGIRLAKLDNFWTGYALVPAQPLGFSGSRLLPGLILAVVLTDAAVIAWLVRCS